jgi:hypothetical protein
MSELAEKSITATNSIQNTTSSQFFNTGAGRLSIFLVTDSILQVTMFVEKSVALFFSK